MFSTTYKMGHGWCYLIGCIAYQRLPVPLSRSQFKVCGQNWAHPTSRTIYQMLYQITNGLIWLAIVDHGICYFKFRNHS